MPTIHPDVYREHLNTFRNERNLLSTFLPNFDVTWARRRTLYNTEFSVYFLKPDQAITAAFGVSNEILLVVSDYTTLQDRLMQAAEQLFVEDPARGRVDPSMFFLASADQDANRWVERYTAINAQTR